MRSALTPRLANRLRTLRQDRGWSLDELTDRSGVSRATLSRMEHAEVSPTAESLSKIAVAYGVPASRLLMMAEDPHTPLVTSEDQPMRRDPVTGIEERIMSPAGASLSAKIITYRCPPGTTLNLRAPQPAGQEVHIVLQDGGAEAVVDGETHTLAVGDCLRVHIYSGSELRADPKLGAQLLMVRV